MDVNVTVSIDDDLMKKVSRIAAERHMTLNAMICEYLEKIASEDAAFGRQGRARDVLEKTFRDLEFRVGKRTRKREGLYERHSGI